MNRIELAKETLQHAIDNMVDAIVKTCVEDGEISFVQAEEISNATIADSMAQGMVSVAASALAAGLSANLKKESGK